MKILVAGAQGQLARALSEQAQAHKNCRLTVLGRPQLDLTDQGSIARAIEAEAPDLIVNAAAYTAVDKAESDPQSAFAVNRDGARALAAAARTWGSPIIHVSTDYVFDGAKQGAYTEADAPNPIGVYAQSKLAGEAAVAAANPEHVILRTAWLYSAHGHNFLKTMLRLARERPLLRVVADQWGNPTFAPHLADGILAIAARLADRPDADAWGIYHAAASGKTTWHAFASAIVDSGAARLGAPRVPVIPITTAEYPLPAKRPANSCLDCSKLARVFGVRLPPWQQGMEACIAEVWRGQTLLV